MSEGQEGKEAGEDGRPVTFGHDGRRLYGFDADLFNKMEAKRDRVWERGLMEWVQEVVEEELPDLDDAWLCLKSGVILCRLINKIRPGSVKNFAVAKLHPLVERDNIQLFLKACWRLALPSSSLFTASDLYQKKGLPQVFQCLHALSKLHERLCRQRNQPLNTVRRPPSPKKWGPVQTAPKSVHSDQLRVGEEKKLLDLQILNAEQAQALQELKGRIYSQNQEIKELRRQVQRAKKLSSLSSGAMAAAAAAALPSASPSSDNNNNNNNNNTALLEELSKTNAELVATRDRHRQAAGVLQGKLASLKANALETRKLMVHAMGQARAQLDSSNKVWAETMREVTEKRDKAHTQELSALQSCLDKAERARRDEATELEDCKLELANLHTAKTHCETLLSASVKNQEDALKELAEALFKIRVMEQAQAAKEKNTPTQDKHNATLAPPEQWLVKEKEFEVKLTEATARARQAETQLLTSNLFHKRKLMESTAALTETQLLEAEAKEALRKCQQTLDSAAWKERELQATIGQLDWALKQTQQNALVDAKVQQESYWELQRLLERTKERHAQELRALTDTEQQLRIELRTLQEQQNRERERSHSKTQHEELAVALTQLDRLGLQLVTKEQEHEQERSDWKEQVNELNKMVEELQKALQSATDALQLRRQQQQSPEPKQHTPAEHGKKMEREEEEMQEVKEKPQRPGSTGLRIHLKEGDQAVDLDIQEFHFDGLKSFHAHARGSLFRGENKDFSLLSPSTHTPMSLTSPSPYTDEEGFDSSSHYKLQQSDLGKRRTSDSLLDQSVPPASFSLPPAPSLHINVPQQPPPPVLPVLTIHTSPSNRRRRRSKGKRGGSGGSASSSTPPPLPPPSPMAVSSIAVPPPATPPATTPLPPTTPPVTPPPGPPAGPPPASPARRPTSKHSNMSKSKQGKKENNINRFSVSSPLESDLLPNTLSSVLAFPLTAKATETHQRTQSFSSLFSGTPARNAKMDIEAARDTPIRHTIVTSPRSIIVNSTERKRRKEKRVSVYGGPMFVPTQLASSADLLASHVCSLLLQPDNGVDAERQARVLGLLTLESHQRIFVQLLGQALDHLMSTLARQLAKLRQGPGERFKLLFSDFLLRPAHCLLRLDQDNDNLLQLQLDDHASSLSKPQTINLKEATGILTTHPIALLNPHCVPSRLFSICFDTTTTTATTTTTTTTTATATEKNNGYTPPAGPLSDVTSTTIEQNNKTASVSAGKKAMDPVSQIKKVVGPAMKRLSGSPPVTKRRISRSPLRSSFLNVLPHSPSTSTFSSSSSSSSSALGNVSHATPSSSSSSGTAGQPSPVTSGSGNTPQSAAGQEGHCLAGRIDLMAENLSAREKWSNLLRLHMDRVQLASIRTNDGVVVVPHDKFLALTSLVDAALTNMLEGPDRVEVFTAEAFMDFCHRVSTRPPQAAASSAFCVSTRPPQAAASSAFVGLGSLLPSASRREQTMQINAPFISLEELVRQHFRRLPFDFWEHCFWKWTQQQNDKQQGDQARTREPAITPSPTAQGKSEGPAAFNLPVIQEHNAQGVEGVVHLQEHNAQGVEGVVPLPSRDSSGGLSRPPSPGKVEGWDEAVEGEKVFKLALLRRIREYQAVLYQWGFDPKQAEEWSLAMRERNDVTDTDMEQLLCGENAQQKDMSLQHAREQFKTLGPDSQGQVSIASVVAHVRSMAPSQVPPSWQPATKRGQTRLDFSAFYSALTDFGLIRSEASHEYRPPAWPRIRAKHQSLLAPGQTGLDFVQTSAWLRTLTGEGLSVSTFQVFDTNRTGLLELSEFSRLIKHFKLEDI